MNRSRLWIIGMAALVAVGIACAAPGGTQGTTPAASDASQEAPAGATQESSTEAAVPGEPVLAALGLPVITLNSATEGAGPKPLFEWEAMDGAAIYTLVVKTADGESYWAWNGAETSVYMGGGSTAPDDNAGGPILFEPMRWAVLAFDADGALIATSQERPIAP